MRTPATRHQKLRSLLEQNPSIFSGADHDELLRRFRELEALEERGRVAYESGDLDRAEDLDAEYAERADELEGWVAEIIEGHSAEDREPTETDLHPLVPGGVIHGKHEGAVAPDLTARLSALFDEFIETEGTVRDRFDPDIWTDRPRPFPIESREDVLGYLAKSVIEDHFEQRGKLAHVPASEFVEAARDAHERRHELVMRYRAKRTKQPKPNAPNPIPRTTAVFDEMMDLLEDGPFDDFGELGLASDKAAGDGGARQFAYCRSEPDAITIAFAPKAEALPHANLVGLMAHEVGHAIDARYPLEVILERTGMHGLSRGAERRADEIAEAALGVLVRYDAQDVQCVGYGTTPRPGHLVQNAIPARSRPRELARGTARVEGVVYPIVFEWVRYHDGFSVTASVADESDAPASLMRGRARQRKRASASWPRVGILSMEERDYGEGDVMAVYRSHVQEPFRGQGLGSKLYELAAQVSCEQFGMDFASDTSRSYDADRRWEALGATAEGVAGSDWTDDGYDWPGGFDAPEYYLLRCRRGRVSRKGKKRPRHPLARPNPEVSEEEITPDLLEEWDEWSSRAGLLPNAGQRVHAYRNLQPGRVKVPHRWPTGAVVYSVQDAKTRRVVGAWPEVVVKDATFFVSDKGLARVRRQGQRAVIAWVTGEWKKSGAPKSGWERVYFNPWKVDYFIQSSTGRRVYRAKWVRLDEDGAWAILGRDAFRP
ncbi:MAG TPA: hypothetical protein VIY27_08280 [Myxococcota bacterium]